MYGYSMCLSNLLKWRHIHSRAKSIKIRHECQLWQLLSSRAIIILFITYCWTEWRRYGEGWGETCRLDIFSSSVIIVLYSDDIRMKNAAFELWRCLCLKGFCRRILSRFSLEILVQTLFGMSSLLSVRVNKEKISISHLYFWSQFNRGSQT